MKLSKQIYTAVMAFFEPLQISNLKQTIAKLNFKLAALQNEKDFVVAFGNRMYQKHHNDHALWKRKNDHLKKLLDISNANLFRQINRAEKLQSTISVNNWKLVSILQSDVVTWSNSVFGSERGPEACIAHLKKEVDELLASPHDRMEYADCLMLLLDAYWRSGGSAEDLIKAAFQKLEINKARIWGKPDANGVVEHVRTNEMPQVGGTKLPGLER